jgi:hypothetical protein
MSINTQRITSAEKCTDVLNAFNLEKSALKYRQTVLEKQIVETDLSVQDNTGAIAQINLELETIQNALPNIPDGSDKLDLQMRVNELENDLLDLETETQVKGIVLRLRREMSLAMNLAQQLANAEGLGMLEARLAELDT